MKKRFILLGCCLFILSCHFKKEKNYPIIPKDDFIKVLVDYHLASGVSYSELYREKMKGLKQMNVNDTVLKSYGYSRAVFDSTISYYCAYPEKFDDIYDQVIDKLSIMQAKVQQRIVKAQAIEQKNAKKREEELKKLSLKKAAEKQDSIKKKEQQKLKSVNSRNQVQQKTPKKQVLSPQIK